MNSRSTAPLEMNSSGSDAIPQSMRRAKRWLVWKLLPATNPGSKPRKVPYYADGKPRSGALDTPADDKRLVTYAAACKALKCGKYAGPGFALGAGWQGLDLDGVRDPDTGKLAPWAEKIMDASGTYAEVSPSGCGVHLIGRGMEELATMGSNKSGVEFYASGRYFTVTGEALKRAEPKTLASVYSLAQKRWLEFSAGNLPTTGAKKAGASSPLLWFDNKQSFDKHLPAIDSADRDTWLKVGMAIHKESGGSAEGFALWTAWSASSDKFDASDQSRVWNSFKGKTDGVGLGTVIQMAREAAADSTATPSLHQRILQILDRQTSFAGRRQIPEPDYYIEGLVLSHLAGVLVSQGGLGKTILLILMGIQTALGGEWLGMRVKQGSFVLLSLDDPQEDLDAALALLVQALALSESEAEKIYACVVLVSLRNTDDVLAFATTDTRGGVIRTNLAQDIAELFAGFAESRPSFNLRCIVFDTLRQFAGGTTNDDRVMTLATKAVTSIADKLKCAAIITHHTTKAGAREGLVDQYSGSGSGALADNMRFVLAFTETEKAKITESVNVEPLLVPMLDTSQLMVLHDTRGSLLRKTLAPIYIARDGYRFSLIDGRRITTKEKAHAKELAVLRAVAAGHASGNAVITHIGGKRTKELAIIAEVIAKGWLARQDGKSNGNLLLTETGRALMDAPAMVMGGSRE